MDSFDVCTEPINESNAINIGLHIIYRIKNIEYRIAVLVGGSVGKVWVGSGNNIIVLHLLTPPVFKLPQEIYNY